MGILIKARKWVIEQRLAELRKAVKYWPNSERLADRQKQIQSLEVELKHIDEEG